MTARHPAIVHWTEIEELKPFQYTGSEEPMAYGANFRRHFQFKGIGIHHERLPPGRRLSRPHAESAEEEFVYVLEGTPDVWLDGVLHRLAPGDAVGFPAGEGLAHTIVNNADTDVHLLVVGEASKPENKIIYPLNPEMAAVRADWWDDAPSREIGTHDSMPDALRTAHGRTNSEK